MNPLVRRLDRLGRGLLIATTLPFVSSPLMAAAEAFPPTESKTNEIKTLPAGVLLKAETAGSYFDNGGSLFRPLFRYISDHNIAMTTPVEATIDDAAMMFWVAPSETDKVAGSKNGVEVIEVPERTVAVRGAKGGYNESNYHETRQELERWLAEQTDWRATAEPYGVYWNGPFTPWFLKTYEVHIPVERISAELDLSAHRWKDRVLVVETPSLADPAFVEQQTRFDAHAAGMSERDLVVKTQIGHEAFAISLYGKDSGKKMRQAEPVEMKALFALIDSMPMRQTEMRQP
jgi:hypothetical protein